MSPSNQSLCVPGLALGRFVRSFVFFAFPQKSKLKKVRREEKRVAQFLSCDVLEEELAWRKKKAVKVSP